MILRVLFFCVFSVCLSQNNTPLDSLAFNSCFEVNNIGDPVIFLTPRIISNDFFLNHVSKNIRRIDFKQPRDFSVEDTIYSYISYTGAYKYGGLLETFLTRPIGQYVKLNFFYNNLSSEGFYNHQHNKYGNMFLSIDFKKNNLYSYSFSFSSINGKYEQSGGLVLYNEDLSPDLNPTYLNSANTDIKVREIQFSQIYLFKTGLKLTHDLSTVLFKRDFFDLNPSSYYYSFTSFNLGLENYTLNTFFNSISNTLSLSKNKFNVSLSHNYYNTNNLVVDKIGDVILSFNSTELFKNENNIYFNLAFCPIGYNKNNYLLDLRLYKNTLNFKHIVSVDFSSKKPNFFREHYSNNSSWDWLDFKSSTVFSCKIKSILNKRHLIGSFLINRSSNFLYFNQLAAPVQFNEPITYLNFKLNKTWYLGDFSFNTGFCVQYADNEVISVPTFFNHQKIKYSFDFINDMVLSSSLSIYLFSKYYPDSFFPLTDVFYQQRSQESEFQPFLSGDIFLSKKNFSFGFILNNLQTLFIKDSYFLPSYPLTQSTVRLSIKWGFLD